MKADSLKKIIQNIEDNITFALIKDLKNSKEIFFYPDIDPINYSNLPEKLILDIHEALKKDKSLKIDIDNNQYFVQVFNLQLRLIIIGAVHIAFSLSKMASLVGYEVTIVDPRKSFLESQDFSDFNLISKWPDEALEYLNIDRRTAIVTLSHDPKLDEPALIQAFKANPFYIGALGSKKTHKKRTERLSDLGIEVHNINRINSPVGLDLGAISPEEISVSILAEMTKYLRKK